MNKVYCPTEGRLIDKHVDEMSCFADVDDALYYHEQPFYSYCASGGGSNPDERWEWRLERERLTRLWHKLHPATPEVDICAVKGTSFFRKIANFFKV